VFTLSTLIPFREWIRTICIPYSFLHRRGSHILYCFPFCDSGASLFYFLFIVPYFSNFIFLSFLPFPNYLFCNSPPLPSINLFIPPLHPTYTAYIHLSSSVLFTSALNRFLSSHYFVCPYPLVTIRFSSTIMNNFFWLCAYYYYHFIAVI
jgi:hypothetical protein